MGLIFRLQAALAQLGFASRRGAAKIIKAGRVKVNGRVILEPGQRVNLRTETITVDGRSSCLPEKVYVLLNKPAGVVSTVGDRHAGRSVVDLIKNVEPRIYPVGRLDKDTTGLIILTNDGELAYRLTHPKFGVKKVYQVAVKGKISPANLKQLEAGVLLEGQRTYPCKIRLISSSSLLSRLEVQLSEGRKRQIKKMFALLGHPVITIKRTAIGPLQLANLKAGQWRRLNKKELTALKQATGSRI